MRHRKAYRKLSKPTPQRKALLRSQLISLFEHGRIVTTLPRAKEVGRIAEKLLTIAREDSVYNRRLVYAWLQDRELVRKVFVEIAPQYKDKNGGYVRILKIGMRRGDAAEEAVLEFV
ncbi:MAG TPA: 50S ribosomal protein L17 [Dictyoglomaceae bacterium]|nr:50S ribosomal protein L17 [Dictyoglomaceae bacterium]HOL38810.1 50S ribosomal protein L17 [Dictyoglomaceae bacterium]HOP94486.1 50S ribosomal protein L17 [Dictyoglomaceae bacterium]HPP15442.1 50S ribosomal protein L17 [Dictyoglomaceae bacterium]HPU43218.1 50S ribosomal protein L17 [Dictyoglomaceae bacterium]